MKQKNDYLGIERISAYIERKKQEENQQTIMTICRLGEKRKY